LLNSSRVERCHYDLSTWEEVDGSMLGSKARKRLRKRRVAVRAYLTTDTPIDTILEQHGISSYEILLQWVARCLALHEDGRPWGYRALLRDAYIKDSSPTLHGSRNRMECAATDDEQDTDMGVPAVQAVSMLQSESDTDAHVITVERPIVLSSPEVAKEDVEDAEKREAAQLVPPLGEEDEVTEKRAVNVPEVLPVEEEDEATAKRAAIKPAAPPIEEAADEPPEYVASALPLSGRVRRHSPGVVWPIVHKRQQRAKQARGRAMRRYSLLGLAIVAALLLASFVPVSAAIAAYSVYNNVRSVALDGVNSLLAVKALLPVSKSNPLAVLDPVKLRAAQGEFRRANGDFLQLQALVSRPDIQSLADEVSPAYEGKLAMARHLVQVGLDVSRMGDELSGVALLGASILHGSPLASSGTQPLVTTADVQQVEGGMVHALYYLHDIQVQMSQVQVSELPITAQQRAELLSLLPLLPKAETYIEQAQGYVGMVAWLLGVGQPRRYLVQTMDNAELRPSGGFTGQYGVLQIQNGRMAPFSLRDVALLDYAGNGVELGRQAPPQYRSWMNFGDWGLRDSNLSGDYPTTARLDMQVFEDEGGGPVDGDISFTPTFIGHIIDVTGPIYVAEYNETITSKNLADRLHYYQQNYNAIALEEQKTGSDSHSVRKAFTSLLGSLLLDKVRHLSTSKLLDIVKGAIKDIQARDLEIYLTDAQAEAWLVAHGYSGGMSDFSGQDGFMVVQANISVSKASQYVTTTEHDDVVLDAQGGATHTLTITLNYQQTGPVYGFDTYADYVRVYVPPTAEFLSGDGFDTGQCLPPPSSPPVSGSAARGSSANLCCTDSDVNPQPPDKGVGKPSQPPAPPLKGCTAYQKMFPSSARVCPNGNYSLGDRDFKLPWMYDKLGPPTALASDLSGRAMFGGLTVTPKNCISTVTLSWYVPHAVTHSPGQPPYALLVQKQGGYVPTVQISIDASSANLPGWQSLTYSGALSADKLFALARI
jgi:hypothetical protein